MTRRLVRLLVPLLLVPAVSRGADPARVSAADLPRLIRENNEQVRAAREMREAARAATGVLRRSFLPEISAEAGHETFRTLDEDRRSEPFGAVEGALNVYRGGRDRLRERREEVDLRQAEAELQDVYREQLQAATDAFWALAFQREMTRALARAVETNDSFLTAARRRASSGLSTATDSLEFEIFRRELEQDLARLAAEQARSEKTLAFLINAPAVFDTPPQIPHDHEERLLAATIDLRSHPSVALADAARRREKLEARSARRWWAPSIDLYSAYSLYTFREREADDRSDRDETVVGGKISLPLFDGLRSSAEARAAELRARGEARRGEQALRRLELEVEATREELRRLHDLVHSAEEGVALGERYLRNTLTEYTRGVKNSPDLAGAVEKLVGLKRRSAEIRLDYQRVKARLLALIGEPAR